MAGRDTGTIWVVGAFALGFFDIQNLQTCLRFAGSFLPFGAQEGLLSTVLIFDNRRSSGLSWAAVRFRTHRELRRYALLLAADQAVLAILLFQLSVPHHAVKFVWYTDGELRLAGLDEPCAL